MLNDASKALHYILSLSKKDIKILNNEVQMSMAIIQELYRLAEKYEKGSHQAEIEKIFGDYISRIER